MKVDSKKTLSKLTYKSMGANRSRNTIAVLAIALTTILFTALFTIALTIMHSTEQQTFRQVGGSMHGTYKALTEEQLNNLKTDPRIVKYGTRLMLGMVKDIPFNKAHVEISYLDKNCAEGFFTQPEHGSLPKEDTKEIAVDTRILSILGIENPKIGDPIPLTYTFDNGEKVSDTFTLSGWWTYDPVAMASQAITSLSYAEQALQGYESAGSHDTTGKWFLDVNFKNTFNIEKNILDILADKGYQSADFQKEAYIDIGVNWAYTNAQLSGSIDTQSLLGLIGVLAVIVFTGYLIIYNIFQISVAGDIRYYGLLKTIGTTGKQIRGILLRQAMLLSVIGIPLGLVLGYLLGNVLAPVVISTMSYTTTHATANPLIFVGAALFSLVTVLISCRKPAKMAGKVSPVEAVRYSESSGVKAKRKKSRGNVTPLRMALANLGRNRKKTILVVVSLSLAVVLLQVTYVFTNGFDMDKYLRTWVVSDFIFGKAPYFQTGNSFSADSALPEEAIDAVHAQGNITKSGRIYGKTTAVEEYVTEDWLRGSLGRWSTPENLDKLIESLERNTDGLLAYSAQLYGMEDYPLDQLKLIEGDLAPLHDPTQNAIAAVYQADDYDILHENSHWAKVGDKVTLRHVDSYEYVDSVTGKVYDSPEKISNHYVQRAASYRDVEYTVTAIVTISHAMSYRYSGNDEFILNAEVFKRDTMSDGIMTYLFDTEEEAVAPMEEFLANYTEKVDISLDYESKQDYVDEFNGFRNMFLLLGSALCGIVGFVGILNFFNAILTSIMARKREFAMLQSVGMTGKQLKSMLVWEGVLYAVFSGGISLALAVGAGPLMGNAMNSMFWFFTYQFSLMPFVFVTPIFLLLGILLPLFIYRVAARHTIVERLREAE